jgi:ATP-dependent DNA helicase DinG
MAVIDEAHTLEANAADHLGLNVSKLGVISMLNLLYNPDNGKGLLVRNGKKAMECRQLCAKARDVVYTFFKQFEDYCEDRHETALRIRQTGLFDNTLGAAMSEFREKLDELHDEIEDDASLQTEIGSYIDRAAGIIDSISEFLLLGNEKSVYYIECDNRNTSLQGAPLNIPEILKRELFDTSFPVILSSATLTINNQFDFFFRRTGFENGKTMVLDSPFAPERVEMYIPDEMPEVQGDEHFKKLVYYIKHFVRMTHGKAFVLFTSYSLLQRTAQTMRGFFEEENINLLVQGGDLTRSMLLEEFKNDVDSVLFGTDSFWTGVDVPGEALSNVIITKLPFAVPSHPLIASRCEEIEKQGGNSFRDYSIPDAVLRFRQGIGRLIRSKTDKGIIAVLDKRIVSKFYGRNFLNSIPYKRKIM